MLDRDGPALVQRVSVRLARTTKFGVLVLGTMLAAGVLSASNGVGAARPALGNAGQASPALCGGGGTPPATFAHVIWIWLENHSYGQIIGAPGSSAAQKSPYVNGTLVPDCGLASNFHNLSHPSLPNYIGATSGDTQGISGNCAPAKCPQAAPSLFGQLASTGKTWRSYAESMGGNCSASGNSLYETAHNAALYYYDAAARCPSWDVPLGTTTSGNLFSDLKNNTLPGFAFVIPNECNNGGCSITTGDTWLSTWLPMITATSAYQSGNTALFITWDEGAGGSNGEDCTVKLTDTSCDVPMLVVSPYTKPGTVSATLYTHYSLLRTTEDMLALPHLAHAGDSTTNSMFSAFFGSTGGGGQAPTVTGFIPTSGPVGTTVTINGTNFTGVTSVRFNGTAAMYTVKSTAQITAAVPPSATTGLISVANAHGTGTSSSPFTVTTSAGAPTITSFAPTFGGTGTKVVIHGTNFTGTTSVKLGTTSASFVVASPTTITAIVPAMHSGQYFWSATTAHGTGTSRTQFFHT